MEQMIANLGFPIACVCGLGGCVAVIIKYLLERDKQNREDMNNLMQNLREDHKEDREMYRESIDRFGIVLEAINGEVKANSVKLEIIEDDIKNIKEKMGV